LEKTVISSCGEQERIGKEGRRVVWGKVGGVRARFLPELSQKKKNESKGGGVGEGTGESERSEGKIRLSPSGEKGSQK